MKEYRMIYAALFLITGYLFMHNPVTEYAALFFLLILLPAVTRGVLYIGSGNLKWKLDVKEQTEVGNRNEISLEVTGKYGVCLGRIQAVLKVRNYFTGKEKEYLVILFSEKKRYRANLDYLCKECGCLEVTVVTLKCIDWLGLNTHSIPAEAKKEIYVCPKQCGRECRNGNERETFGSHDKFFPSAWKEGEIRGPREYIQGGPLNRIHWKMSAKTGTLQMIEYENMAEKSLFLLPDFAGADGETADQILEELFSLSRSLIEEGKTHWIGMISDGKLAKFYVNNIESCQTALYQMLRLPYDRKEGAADFYKRVLEKENIRVEMITALSGTGL